MFAHYALQKLHILPSVFASMPENERAFVIASIETRIEAEKEAERKAKHKKR